ncbi:acetylxylan esterase [Jeotgalibacillus soli]|uniref:Acetyl xylan esterase domain-containing protein n=1 Tax=Jeotgalibacillus soli TaxID=889306 RepID=A0A0C2RI64_9BACL|nr:acetylxylan esterase [Jeotgalibacillus soli]KIL49855.1 hypothetical protein KP78_13230 [Jeotgalibacillus soli]
MDKSTYFPLDFEAFWSAQKRKAEKSEWQGEWTERDYPISSIRLLNCTFTSFDGTPINGICLLPKHLKKGPLMICYPGYTGDKGFPSYFLKWAMLGLAVAVFDVRGQGLSPDHARYRRAAAVPGWMLLGADAPETYYFTNVIKDGWLQLQWLLSGGLPFSVQDVILNGSSQGGGLALASGALMTMDDDCYNPSFILSDWPFLSDFPDAVEEASEGPYMEIVQYGKRHDPLRRNWEDLMKTLSYVDSVHFASKITSPLYMAIGTADKVTPPSTVFNVFDASPSKEKHIEVYHGYVHEVNPFHEEKKLAYTAEKMSTYSYRKGENQ